MILRPTSTILSGHRIGLGVCAAFLLLAATACGGSDGSDGSSDASDGSEANTTEPVVEVEEPSSNYELVLDDGTSFGGEAQCALEADDDAMVEYNVRGPGELLTFNLVQWIEGNAIGASQEVEMVDSTSSEPIWRSVGSTGLILERNDNVITGTGDFYQGENLEGPYTSGRVTVTC